MTTQFTAAGLDRVAKAQRTAQIRELHAIIAQVVNDFPRNVRVPHELQVQIAEAVLDSIQY